MSESTVAQRRHQIILPGWKSYREKRGGGARGENKGWGYDIQNEGTGYGGGVLCANGARVQRGL